MASELSGKVAIVTGAGRGIGRAIAEKLAERGAAVVISSRSEAQLTEVVKSIEAKRGNVLAIKGDIRNGGDVGRLISTAVNDFGSLDILVNNAATIGPARPIATMSDDDWYTVIDTNLSAVFRVCRAAIPHLEKTGSGRILNVSSLSASNAAPLMGADGAAKAGLLALTRVLAAELGPKGVTVNALNPGFIPDTQLAQEMLSRLAAATGRTSADLINAIRADSLTGRFASVDDVASVAAFLCSAGGASVTGQEVNVSCGMRVS